MFRYCFSSNSYSSKNKINKSNKNCFLLLTLVDIAFLSSPNLNLPKRRYTSHPTGARQKIVTVFALIDIMYSIGSWYVISSL